ncbi:hypothetical protein WMY93_026064 [Mugilogobius chulae]|uniref:Chromatin target of PRMT1 protein C-terminal domain-containing protein n=1 Tax=Mugilogobius chulae TaxID=88201 RepID=A0AAW0N7C7_9GOBI
MDKRTSPVGISPKHLCLLVNSAKLSPVPCPAHRPVFSSRLLLTQTALSDFLRLKTSVDPKTQIQVECALGDDWSKRVGVNSPSALSRGIQRAPGGWSVSLTRQSAIAAAPVALGSQLKTRTALGDVEQAEEILDTILTSRTRWSYCRVNVQETEIFCVSAKSVKSRLGLAPKGVGACPDYTGRVLQKKVVPSKKQLDAELDQYMSKTKSRLDADLERYMSLSKSRLDAQLDEYMAMAGQEEWE